MTSLIHGPHAAAPAGTARVWVARVTAAIRHYAALATVISASERSRVDRLLRQGRHP